MAASTSQNSDAPEPQGPETQAMETGETQGKIVGSAAEDGSGAARTDAGPERESAEADRREDTAPGIVVLRIAGQAHRVACDPEQADKVRRLGRTVEAKVAALADVGVTPATTPTSRLLLMAALTLADELEQADPRHAATAALELDDDGAAAIEESPAEALDHAFARVLVDAAARLEAMAVKLEAAEAMDLEVEAGAAPPPVAPRAARGRS